MSRVSFRIALLAVVLVVTVAGALYVTAYRSAYAAARAVALGQEIETLGPADLAVRNQLGRPVPATLIVTTSFSESSPGFPEMSFEFLLSNRAASMSSPVRIGVTVQFSLSGWTAIGYGSGG